MKLAQAMVIYRAKEGLSQKELAERCGITTQTINHVENGVQRPSKVTRAKIELVIGMCDPEEGEDE